MQNVKKSFENTEVLKDISLNISEGEIYGLIGHSGAGKSTLLRCINALEDYNEGSVKVMDKEVRLLSEKGNHICSLDLIQNIGINMVIIPVAGIILTGFVQFTVIEIVSDCDYTCSGDLRGFRSFFCLFVFLLCFLGGFFLRLGDQAVVQLMHQENQHDQNRRGT